MGFNAKHECRDASASAAEHLGVSTLQSHRRHQDTGWSTTAPPTAEACIDRLEDRWPTLRLIHLPVHASWLNQVEIYFSVVQRKVVSPNDFHSLSDVESRLLDFQQHYEQIATPVEMEVHQERSERATRAHRRPRSRRPHARCLTRPRMRHRNSVPDH